MMIERTLDDALERARQLAEYKKVNPRYLGTHSDLLDIVLLAEEIERLNDLLETSIRYAYAMTK